MEKTQEKDLKITKLRYLMSDGVEKNKRYMYTETELKLVLMISDIQHTTVRMRL